MGKHNAQDIRAHRQHVDEQLIKLETRQKALLAQHNIEHSPICEPMDFPPPPTFYNPWEIYSNTSMMYGAPRPTLMMKTLVVVRPTTTTLLRRPHSPHDYDG
jgi:hypothetical protein